MGYNPTVMYGGITPRTISAWSSGSQAPKTPATLAVVWFAFNAVTRNGRFSPDSMNDVDVARNILAGRGLVQSACCFNEPLLDAAVEQLVATYRAALAEAAAGGVPADEERRACVRALVRVTAVLKQKAGHEQTFWREAEAWRLTAQQATARLAAIESTPSWRCSPGAGRQAARASS